MERGDSLRWLMSAALSDPTNYHMMPSQGEHALPTITFDHNMLISTATLGELCERHLTKIATFLELPLDTWLSCRDRMVTVVFIKAANGDNAAVHLSATVSTTNKPSIEGFLNLQLEEAGTESKLSVRDLLGLHNVTGKQLRFARYRNKNALQIVARSDLQVQRARKRLVDPGTDDLDQQIVDLNQQIGDGVVEARRQASTKSLLSVMVRYLVMVMA